MPKYVQPTNDAERLTLLRGCLTVEGAETLPGWSGLSPRTVTQVQTFVTKFEAGLQEVALAEALRRQLMLTADAALGQLEIEIRTLVTGVSWQVRRGQASPALLGFYQLTQQGRWPRPTQRHLWLTLGEQLLQGDAAAVAAGFTSAPNRAELEAALQKAKTAMAAFQTQEQALNLARKNCATLRKAANHLIRAVRGELRLLLMSETPAFRRQVMRAYGMHFRSAAGETAEEEPTPEPVTITPPPTTAIPLADAPVVDGAVWRR